MSLVSWIGTVTTVLSVLVFAVVIGWACGRGRRERFAAAAQAPFALPDEMAEREHVANTKASP